jgi:hydrogenase/urease accessory protein HupE
LYLACVGFSVSVLDFPFCSFAILEFLGVLGRFGFSSSRFRIIFVVRIVFLFGLLKKVAYGYLMGYVPRADTRRDLVLAIDCWNWSVLDWM